MKWLILICFLAIVVLGCAITRYQNILISREEVEKVFKNIVLAEVSYKYGFWGEEKEYNAKYSAICLLRSSGKIIGLTHALLPPKAVKIITLMGTIEVPIRSSDLKIVSKKTGEEFKIVGSKDDITVLKGNIELMEQDEIPFGDSNKVKVGDRVVVFGFSFGKFINVKEGIVSVVNHQTNNIPVFIITAPVNPGDSGSMVLAERLGRYEIIGIVNAGYQNGGLGCAIKINYVKGAINEISEKK